MASAFFAATFRDTEYLELDFVYLGTILLAINVALWMVSLMVGKAWPVDFIWSSWPIFQLGYLLYSLPTPTTLHASLPDGHLLVTLVWGARLTFNFINRGGIGHEGNTPTRFIVHFFRGTTSTN